MIRLRIWRWGEYCGVSGWVQYNKKDLRKEEGEVGELEKEI